MNTPQLSVVIPTYQRNDLLSLCLERLAPGVQSLPADRYEVIVTDDGKTSTAAGMIQERFPWARWVAGPRRGPASNRNNGARAAKGEFVVFTDDDCLPSPDWLRSFADSIDPGIAVYEGKTTCQDGVRSPLYHAPINEVGRYLWSCNLMVRAAEFWACGGFDEDFLYAAMEDVAFRETFRRRGLRELFVPLAIVDHPPRRAKIGIGRNPEHESHVIFWQKFPELRQSLIIHLGWTIRTRIYDVLHRPLGLDSLVAIGATLVELPVVAVNWPKWQRIHRQHKNVATPISE